MKNILNKFKLMIEKLLNFLFKNNKKLFFTLGATPVNLMLNELNDVTDNNRALILRRYTRENYSEALEKMSKELDNELNPFEVDFPNYDPNIDIFPVKIIKYINDSIKDSVSDVLSTTLLKVKDSGGLDLLINKIKNTDTIFNLKKEIHNVVIKSIDESSFIINEGKPLGELGEQTINNIIR